MCLCEPVLPVKNGRQCRPVNRLAIISESDRSNAAFPHIVWCSCLPLVSGGSVMSTSLCKIKKKERKKRLNPYLFLDLAVLGQP